MILEIKNKNNKTPEDVIKEIEESGLPIYCIRNAEEMQLDGLYTKSRAKSEGIKIDKEHICGWWKSSAISYRPLYKPISDVTKTERSDPEDGKK